MYGHKDISSSAWHPHTVPNTDFTAIGLTVQRGCARIEQRERVGEATFTAEEKRDCVYIYHYSANDQSLMGGVIFVIPMSIIPL